jgi:hypothetical protein
MSTVYALYPGHGRRIQRRRQQRVIIRTLVLGSAATLVLVLALVLGGWGDSVVRPTLPLLHPGQGILLAAALAAALASAALTPSTLANDALLCTLRTALATPFPCLLPRPSPRCECLFLLSFLRCFLSLYFQLPLLLPLSPSLLGCLRPLQWTP